VKKRVFYVLCLQSNVINIYGLTNVSNFVA